MKGRDSDLYTQDEAYIRNDADTARDILSQVYGDKLGKEAYLAVNKAPVGASFRRKGGPLVQVVTREKACEIREKETAIGMM